MVDDDDLPQKLLRDRRRVVGRTENRPPPEVGLRDAPQVEADVVACLGLLHWCVMSLDRLHLCGDALRHYDNGVPDFHLPSFYPSDGHSPNPCDRVDVLDWNPQRLVNRLRRLGEAVEDLEEGRPLVPRHVRRLLDQVLPRPPRDRDDLHLLDVVTNNLQEVLDVLLRLVEPLLGVLHRLVVHLVYAHHELVDTEGPQQECVFPRLSARPQCHVLLTLLRGYDKDGSVGLGGARDHVLDEVAMPRRIDQRVEELGRLELLEGEVDRDPSLPLVLQLVEDPRILEGVAGPRLLGLPRELFFFNDTATTE